MPGNSCSAIRWIAYDTGRPARRLRHRGADAGFNPSTFMPRTVRTQVEQIMPRFVNAFVGAACVLTAAPGLAQEPEVGSERIRAAVQRALIPVQQGLKTFDERKAIPP